MIQRQFRLPATRSCLLLGPRQTGKSTLIRATLPTKSWTVDLLDHRVFLAYVQHP